MSNTVLQLRTLRVPYHIKDSNQETPYDIAKRRGNHDMVDILKKNYAAHCQAFAVFILINMSLPFSKRLNRDVIEIISEKHFVLE